MIINDRVYGKEVVNEPVVLELLQSIPVQRMKRVGQGGLLDEVGNTDFIVRFDHGFGVAVLLKRLGASLEEQIAGLLHDVSHTAFSHTVDYALGDITKQDFQDTNHSEYIKRTEIPRILSRYGISEHVLDPDQYSLLEQPAPALCADRIDYSLRSCVVRSKDTESRDICLPALIAHKGRIVFNSRKPAETFWRMYAKQQDGNWAEPLTTTKQMILAKAIRAAYDAGSLSMDDLYKDDPYVADILRKSKDPVVMKNMSLLERGFSINPDQKNPDIVLKNKFRYVDPEFLDNGSLSRVSDVVPEYASWFKQTEERYLKGLPVRIVPA